MRRVVAPSLILILLFASQLPHAQEATRVTMHQIMGSLGALLHIGATPEGFSNPDSKTAIETSLGLLAENAAQLAEHAQDSNVDARGAGLLAGSLAGDARTSLALYQEGNVYESRLMVDKLTDACFSCHVRLPGTEGPGLGALIMDRPEIQGLPQRNQLRLAVATRELGRAMDLGEALLKSPKHSALYLDATGVIDDYLRVAILVRGDFDRPRAALEAFRRREDLPEYLTDTVDSWLRALRTLDPAPYSKNKLETAKRLIDQGRAHNTPADQRRGLVHFVQATGLLHQYVEADPDSPAAEAEAYYLLGSLDLELARNPWPAEAQLYLEAAVRAHPGSDTAQDAFRRLEESVAKGYAGVLGTELPPELMDKLQELGDLAFGS